MKHKNILLLIMLLCASCEKESLTVYEEFAQKYYEAHPEGYDEKPQWYTFNAIEMDYNFNSGVRTIREIDFVGLIDFGKDSFGGKTNEFHFKKTTTKMIDNEVKQVIEKERMLCDGNYYQRETINHKDPINKEEKTKGCEGVEYLTIGFPFEEEFFSPKNYDIYNMNYNFLYQSVNIRKDRVTLYMMMPYGNNTNMNMHTETECFYNEKYELTRLVIRENLFGQEDNPYTSKENEHSYFLGGCLEVTKQQEIVVPTDYDEVEKDKDHLWGLRFNLELRGEVET